jgi:hypothetical protein
VALLVEEHGEGLHAEEFGSEVFELIPNGGALGLGFGGFVGGGVVFDDGGDLGVGHAAGGADDSFAELVAEDLAVGVDVHEAAEDEAVFVGAEAADVAGELLGEHGDGAVGEVDGVAAEAGLEVEIGPGEDVFGDVGDVDLKLVGAVGI